MTAPRIDAHCHYFHGRYAAMEARAIVRDLVLGHYPHLAEKALPLADREAILGPPVWRRLVQYIAGLIQVAANSCEENYQKERTDYAASALADAPLRTVPMMMDIYHIVDEGSPDAPAAAEAEPPVAADAESFETRVEALQAMVTDALSGRPAAEAASAPPGLASRADRVDELFRSARDWLLGASAARIAAIADDLRTKYPAVRFSPGYLWHMAELVALGQDHPGEVFPFLAIDPRRTGVDALLDDELLCSHGPFYGVKLYPPLGYLPTHPGLYPVYDFCTERGIPISAHCNDNGLPTWARQIHVWSRHPDIDGELVQFGHDGPNPSAYFAHPARWEPVLEQYGDRDGLRLNLSHLGGDGEARRYVAGEPDTWTGRIIELMHAHEGRLYADVSYHASADSPAIVQQILHQHGGPDSVVGRHLLFGTDYIMVMMHMGLGGLVPYFDRFAALPPAMFAETPRRFLGLPD